MTNQKMLFNNFFFKCNLSCKNLFYFLTIYFRLRLVKECGFEDGQMLCKDIRQVGEGYSVGISIRVKVTKILEEEI